MLLTIDLCVTLHISPHFILTTNLQGSCLIGDEKTTEVGGEITSRIHTGAWNQTRFDSRVETSVCFQTINCYAQACFIAIICPTSGMCQTVLWCCGWIITPEENYQKIMITINVFFYSKSTELCQELIVLVSALNLTKSSILSNFLITTKTFTYCFQNEEVWALRILPVLTHQKY